MTEAKHNGLSKDDVLALRGLRLPSVALKGLYRLGIYCQPTISVEFQQQAGSYVIRGVESGGAVPGLGAYCAFVNEHGMPVARVQPVAALGVNGLHQAVLSSVFVRVQMFRSGHHYELLVTQHALVPTEGKARPALRNSVLFHGKHGVLEMKLWGKDSRLRGGVAPTFYSRSGEQIAPPDCFHDAIVRVTAGVCCVGCRHIHVTGSGPLSAETYQEQTQ
jgi:hypothetical protein